MPRAILTLTVDYDLNGEDLGTLADMTKQRIKALICDGGLTFDSEATVTLWRLTKEVED